jgi:ankyrin repeat protein
MERLIAEHRLTPLHAAAHAGDIDEVNRLVEAGADVNARSLYQATPLHWALKGSSVVPDIFSILVKNGADVNAQDNARKTPLHIASSFGNIPAAERLLSLGASLEIKDEGEQSPVDRAKGKEMDAFFKKITDRIADRKVNAKGLTVVSMQVKPRGEPLPYDLVRTIGANLDLNFDRLTPQSTKRRSVQSAKGRKTRARKTKRRLTRRRK